jgi:predicted DCC family thiol-disulfide oxidoreductase YuxK
MLAAAGTGNTINSLLFVVVTVITMSNQLRNNARSLNPAAQSLGRDKQNRPRSLFLYDGACGVCKFCVRFVAARDQNDHVRFSPLQTSLAADLCREIDIAMDLSTAVLILTENDNDDEDDGSGSSSDSRTRIQSHCTKSSSILRLFSHMGFPYSSIGPVLMLIPLVVRDFGYTLFGRNRGKIWKFVKRVTGIGDTNLDLYRHRIVGLDDDDKPIPLSWGLTSHRDENDHDAKTK